MSSRRSDINKQSTNNNKIKTSTTSTQTNDSPKEDKETQTTELKIRKRVGVEKDVSNDIKSKRAHLNEEQERLNLDIEYCEYVIRGIERDSRKSNIKNELRQRLIIQSRLLCTLKSLYRNFRKTFYCDRHSQRRIELTQIRTQIEATLESQQRELDDWIKTYSKLCSIKHSIEESCLICFNKISSYKIKNVEYGKQPKIQSKKLQVWRSKEEKKEDK
jgi:hypothetical protein